MLGLKLETDPRWVKIAEENIKEILIDHAWCEQKAASNAISILTSFPEKTDLVEALTAIAVEEMQHFGMVHEIIIKKGFALTFIEKDDYVADLHKFIAVGKDRETWLIDRLLFSAMIEARSCERFRILSTQIQDQELAKFYHELMISEATHYTTFIKLAKKYSTKIDVDKRWDEFLEYEAEIMRNYSKKEKMHG